MKLEERGKSRLRDEKRNKISVTGLRIGRSSRRNAGWRLTYWDERRKDKSLQDHRVSGMNSATVQANTSSDRGRSEETKKRRRSEERRNHAQRQLMEDATSSPLFSACGWDYLSCHDWSALSPGRVWIDYARVLPPTVAFPVNT